MILLPLVPLFHVIFFPKALELSTPLHNLNIFPKPFDKLPPPPGVGNEELYTPLSTRLALLQAFKNMLIVPPGSGIVHQVNLEYLARVCFVKDGRWLVGWVVGWLVTYRRTLAL